MSNAERIMQMHRVENADQARVLSDAMNSEVAGMVAENNWRMCRGEHVAYDEVAFHECAKAQIHLAELMGGKLPDGDQS